MKWKSFNWLCIFLIASWSFAGNINGASLFKGRQIQLSGDDSRVFRVGVTGTTAGHNFIALIENAKQESISLGDLGYWEIVADPPSFLRNYDLQFTIKNHFKEKFQIEFEYNKFHQDIRYRILEGAIQVKLDHSEYYPILIIDNIVSEAKSGGDAITRIGSKRFLFYDFNSFDSDLKKYYGSVKRLLKKTNYAQYFYYYESGSYNSYYFKMYQNVAKLDTDKMGLSLEDGTLAYYQKVLDNLKSHFGSDFADQIVIVSRFGKKYSKELNKYANEIGMRMGTVITLWSYDEIE